MTSATVPHPAADDRITGPLRVLIESGASSREIAAQLPISQSTAARRIREYQAARKITHRREVLVAALCITVTVALVILTAAVATIAWG